MHTLLRLQLCPLPGFIPSALLCTLGTTDFVYCILYLGPRLPTLPVYKYYPYVLETIDLILLLLCHYLAHSTSVSHLQLHTLHTVCSARCHEKVIGNLSSHRYVKTFVTSSQIVILQTR